MSTIRRCSGAAALVGQDATSLLASFMIVFSHLAAAEEGVRVVREKVEVERGDSSGSSFLLIERQGETHVLIAGSSIICLRPTSPPAQAQEFARNRGDSG